MANIGYILRDNDIELEWHGDDQTLVVRDKGNVIFGGDSSFKDVQCQDTELGTVISVRLGTDRLSRSRYLYVLTPNLDDLDRRPADFSTFTGVAIEIGRPDSEPQPDAFWAYEPRVLAGSITASSF
jgi:hypothetical protein